MGRRAVGYKEALLGLALLNLLDEPGEARGVQLGQKGRKTFACEGAQGQIQVGAFVAYLDGGDGAVAHRTGDPVVTQFSRGARPQFVMKEQSVVVKLGPELAEVFLKRPTAPGFWRTLTGRPLFRLTFSRLQRSLMPPMVYSTPKRPSLDVFKRLRLVVVQELAQVADLLGGQLAEAAPGRPVNQALEALLAVGLPQPLGVALAQADFHTSGSLGLALARLEQTQKAAAITVNGAAALLFRFNEPLGRRLYCVSIVHINKNTLF